MAATTVTILSRLALLITIASTTFYLFYQAAKRTLALDQLQNQHLRFPPLDLDDVRRLLEAFEQQSEANAIGVFLLYSFAFLIKQTFASASTSTISHLFQTKIILA